LVGAYAIGACAIGAYAIGACAIGACAIGAYAIGAYAIGACAIGAYAIGAYAIGAYAIGAYAIGAYKLGLSCNYLAIPRIAQKKVGACLILSAPQIAHNMHSEHAVLLAELSILRERSASSLSKSVHEHLFRAKNSAATGTGRLSIQKAIKMKKTLL
jgi:hypothetical protein